jgi:hypothetical protein
LFGDVPAVAVLYTKRLVAGDVTGELEVIAVSATRGIKRPELVEETSSIADGAGALPEALIPIFCASIPWSTPIQNTILR